MRKRVFGVALAAAALAGGIGVQASATPGPNGHNNYGLCKAYFSGSANGQANKHKAPPFAELERQAEAQDQTVAEFCASATPGGK